MLRLDRDPAERVDAAAYLRARLVDLVIGDVDRHPGNWRWARLDPDGPWLPVAEDRDLAFARFGGVLVGAARPVYPVLASYDAEANDPAYFSKDLARYRNVTTAQVKDAVAKYLGPNARVVLTISPGKKSVEKP